MKKFFLLLFLLFPYFVNAQVDTWQLNWNLDIIGELQADTMISVGWLKSERLSCERLGKFSAGEVVSYNNVLVMPFDPDADEEAWINLDLGPEYLAGSNITGYVHWLPATTNVGTVTWVIEYESIAQGGTPTGTGTKIIITDDSDGNQYKRMMSDLFTIPGTGITKGTLVTIHFYRDANATEDGADDDFTGDAGFLKIALNISCDIMR